MLRSILIAALLAGAIGGGLLTAIQQLQTTPLILEAEKFETAAGGGPTEQHADGHGHEHGEAWSPEAGTERLSFTLLSNVLASIGFAMLIACGITLSGHKGWAKGLLWGLAGYAVFFVAPSLGLHPKLPGTVSAPLQDQHIWWLATVAASATGLSLLIFAKSILLKGVGLLFMLIPHLVGTPLPQETNDAISSELSKDFIIASSIANGVFWLILGALSGYLMHKVDFSPRL